MVNKKHQGCVEFIIIRYFNFFLNKKKLFKYFFEVPNYSFGLSVRPQEISQGHIYALRS